MGIKTSANTRADDNFIKEQCDVSCTIRTNINTANHHFIVEECNSKENISTPTKVSTGTQHKSSFEDNLGGYFTNSKNRR